MPQPRPAAPCARWSIDVNVGLPRCGCDPGDAGRLADLARRKGLGVRGVMGYEGHAVGMDDRSVREQLCAQAMELLLAAQRDVGGDVISAGGTGTYDINTWANEIQAGSYALMDTAYGKLGLPFVQALWVWSTVISVSPAYAVADCGLKSLGMDHGNPSVEQRLGVVLLRRAHHVRARALREGRRPGAGRPGAHRPDGRLPRSHAPGVRRARGRDVARRPARLVGQRATHAVQPSARGVGTRPAGAGETSARPPSAISRPASANSARATSPLSTSAAAGTAPLNKHARHGRSLQHQRPERDGHHEQHRQRA